MVADGLKVMRDVADGLTIPDVEVQAEKGVVDGEERERDRPEVRAGLAALAKVFAGTLVPTRIPIGKKAVRDAFDAKAVRAFYEKWYRPENYTLLLVGDLAGRDPTKQIQAAFGDLKQPASPAPGDPELGTPTLDAKAFFVFDHELPNVTLEVQRLVAHEERPDTKATRLADVARDHAHAMIDLRLEKLVKKADAPFLAAQAGRGGGFDLLEGEALSVTCEPKKWREALLAVETELRRALAHGFDQSELDEVRKNELRELDEAVSSEKTRPSASYVHELLSAAHDRLVPTDAATDRSLYKPALEALTCEACQKALAKEWSLGTLMVSATGGLDLAKEAKPGEAPEQQLLDAWAAGEKVEVAESHDAVAQKWGYAADPALAGKVATRKHVDEFDFEDVLFENGVRLLVKKTDFTAREIQVRAFVGEGALTLDPKQNVLREFATRTLFPACGLGKHSIDDLRKLTAGRQIGAQFLVNDDVFTIAGATTKDDLELECELTCAALTDPGWREEGAVPYRRAIPQVYERMVHDPRWPVDSVFLPSLFGHDPRVAPPGKEALLAVTLDQEKAWLQPAMANAPIDVVLVGDVDVDAAVTGVANTFGALPKRRAREEWKERRVYPTMKGGVHESYTVESERPAAIALVDYATTDGFDSPTRRALLFLARVVSDRLRLEIREKRGMSYSPNANTMASRVYPGYGELRLFAGCKPEDADAMVDAMVGVGEALAKDGVTDEEVGRLRPAFLAELRDQLRRNDFWANSLGELHAGRPALEDIRTLVPFYEKLTAAPLTELAKKYLKRDLASTAVVRPVAAEKSEKPKPTGQ
jgi:zinc protease